MQFVYRYMDRWGDFPTYVGVTNNLVKRHNEHLASGHEYAFPENLEYFTVETREQAETYETYLINCYQRIDGWILHNKNSQINQKWAIKNKLNYKDIPWRRYDGSENAEANPFELLPEEELVTQPLPTAGKERIIDEEGKERRNFGIRRDERENLRRALLINLDQDGMVSINKIDEIISRMNDADKEAILYIDPDRRARIMARKEKLSQKEKCGA